MPRVVRNTGKFNRWEFGLAGGLGFDIANFTLGARYNYGLYPAARSLFPVIWVPVA